jgi:gamma-glutamyltranspeptidase/glutathione hydrolase
MVETVVLAPKCGLAGDLVALHLRVDADEPDALIAVGMSPEKLGAAVTDSGALPTTGGLSVGVPGAPAGYLALAERCLLPLEDLVAPARLLAERGFAWPRLCAALAHEADELLVRHQPDGCRFRPRARPLVIGERVQLPGLARVLEALVSQRGRLYEGTIGEAVIQRVEAAGGVLSLDDLRSTSQEWEHAVALRSADGATLWSTPSPTYGPALLAVLRPQPKDRGLALARAVESVLGEQARSGRTPEFWRTDGTSVVAASDAEGGAVVVVHSNSFPQFGSGLVVDDFDLVLSNRAGRGFSSKPTSDNFPAPGRRPLTTLHAWAAGMTRPHLLGGTAGGVQQVAWNAQVLTSLLNDSSGPDISGAGPSTHSGRSERLGDPGDAMTSPLWQLDGSSIIAEADADIATTPGVARVEPLSMRSTQVIVAPGGPNALARAWADPRHGAIALAV